MQYPPQSQSEIACFIKGLENVHCVLENPQSVRDFYSRLFGPPGYTDGEWSELKIAGFDFAVTAGKTKKFVITFKAERLEELRPLLEAVMSLSLPVQRGDYGDYIEICPADGFCMHFSEAKPRTDAEDRS